jgi:inner membrane protein involved in colicin E2 resistance
MPTKKEFIWAIGVAVVVAVLALIPVIIANKIAERQDATSSHQQTTDQGREG